MVGSLKLAVVECLYHGNWHMLPISYSAEACMPGYRWSLSSQLSPPRQHGGQASSVLWVQPILLLAGPSLRPGRGACPSFCRVSLPGLSPTHSCHVLPEKAFQPGIGWHLFSPAPLASPSVPTGLGEALLPGQAPAPSPRYPYLQSRCPSFVPVPS